MVGRPLSPDRRRRRPRLREAVAPLFSLSDRIRECGVQELVPCPSGVAGNRPLRGRKGSRGRGGSVRVGPLPPRRSSPIDGSRGGSTQAPGRGRSSGTVGPNSSRRGAPPRRRKRLLQPWRASAVGLHQNSLRPPPDPLRTAEESRQAPTGGRPTSGGPREPSDRHPRRRRSSAERAPSPGGPSRTPNADRSAAPDGERDSTRPPRSGSTPIVRSPPGPPAGRSRRRPSCDRLRPAPVIIPLPEMEGFGPRGPRKGTQ